MAENGPREKRGIMENQDSPGATINKPKIPTQLVVPIVCFVAGILVGAFLLSGLFSGGEGSGSQGTSLSPTTVFSRIQERGELVSVSQDYTIIDKVTKSNRDFLDLFDVPFTENSFWYRYAGTIKAGVNLETAKIEQDANDPTVLHITLEAPYIISNTPDMERTGVLEQNNNIFNPISIEQSDEFQAECVKRSQKEAIEGGLLEEARANAEVEITQLFTAAFGEDAYTIDFIWLEAE